MKRYTVSFMSNAVGKPVAVNETDSPQEAYTQAMKLSRENTVNDIRVADMVTQKAYDIATFKAMHRL
jgi:hypothetical protein